MTDTTGSADLAKVRNSLAAVSKGKDVREDAWMTTWCSTSWGDLLQPAPLSISLLGSILIIASATDDFSLISDAPEGVPAFDWKYAQHPDSFQTCLQQLVGAGYTAFETVHGKMETIKNTSTQMPSIISELVGLILTGKPDEIDDQFSGMVDDLLGMSNKCMQAATQSEASFQDITGLCQELVLACTYRAGTAQQALAQNEIHLAVLKVQKDQESTMLEQSKETTKMMKDSYTQAEEQFHSAVESVPSGWDLVGMQVVESLTSLVVAAGNAAISQATMESQAASAGIGAFKGTTGTGDKSPTTAKAAKPSPVVPTTSPTGVSSQPSGGALSDPAVTLAQTALTYASATASLIGRGKPDWDRIRSKDPNTQSGAAYLQASFESTKSRLDPSKPISPRLITFIDQGIAILRDVMKVAGSVDSANDDALASEEPKITNLVSDLQSLVTSCNLILQQPGATSTGPATPATPASVTNSASKMAVETAKFKVDSTKSALEAARASFERSSNQLMQQQQEITKTIGDMTKLSLASSNLSQMLPVLKKAVGSFTTLRAQFSQLVQFFMSVSSLLNDVMGPSVNRWVAAISAGEKKAVAGVTIGAFTRDLIYRQCQTPLKVATLAEQISTTYGKVSQDYIMPAQRKVGEMLKFADSPSAADRAKLVAQLRVSQGELAAQSAQSSQSIHDLVETERKKFADVIEKRLQTVMAGMKAVMPSVTDPLPQNIQVIQDSHVVDFAATKQAQADANPMFDPNDA